MTVKATREMLAYSVCMLYKAETAQHVGTRAHRSRSAFSNVIRLEGRGRSALLTASSSGLSVWLDTSN